MSKRFPPGWDLNPSAWDERLPVIGIALGALCLPPSGTPQDEKLRLLLLTVAALTLLGGERRWIAHPIVVLAFGLLTGPLLFYAGVSSLVAMAVNETWHAFSLARAVLALVLIGPALDEVLATLQYLRRRVL